VVTVKYLLQYWKATTVTKNSQDRVTETKREEHKRFIDDDCNDTYWTCQAISSEEVQLHWVRNVLTSLLFVYLLSRFLFG